MRVYLSGPMRGLPDWNFPAFAEAKARWEAAGHQVFCPATMCQALGYEDPTLPAEPDGGAGTSHLKHVLLSDVACLLHAEAIALLPGWEGSRGATMEVAIGQFLGLLLFDATTTVSLLVPSRPWAVLQASVTELGELRKLLSEATTRNAMANGKPDTNLYGDVRRSEVEWTGEGGGVKP